MNRVSPTVACYLRSLQNFAEHGLAYKVLSTINKCDLLLPTVYGEYTPDKNYDMNNLDIVIETWLKNGIAETEQDSSTGLVMKNKDKISYSIYWEKTQLAHFNTYTLAVNIEYLKRKEVYEQYLWLIREIALILDAAQGSIVNRSFSDTFAPIDLKIRHPELWWINFFGQPYIDMFGRDKLLNAPCYRVHEIADHLIAIQLTENVFEEVPPSIKNAVKEHLGRDAFVWDDTIVHRYKHGMVPEFDFSDVLTDKTKPIEEPKIIVRSKKRV